MQTITPPSTKSESPTVDKRNWVSATLAALAILAVAAAAIWWFAIRDGDSEPAAVAVTGTETCVFEGPAAGGAIEFRCEETASDPRAAGEGIVILTFDQGSGAMSGTFEIVNDDGTWTGPFSGFDNATDQYVDAQMVGTGEYEGLQYRMHVEFAEEEGGIADVTGTIEPVP